MYCLAALYLGIKMFIVEFIFLRFPRVKHNHDSVYILWRNLPTNAHLRQSSSKDATSRVSLPCSEVSY